MKTPVLAGIVVAVLILGAIIATTFGNQEFRVEVCMTYKGRQSCRVSSARTKESAKRTATSNACALISSGSFDASHCENGEPDSVKWLNSR